jgi:hypothetical protein
VPSLLCAYAGDEPSPCVSSGSKLKTSKTTPGPGVDGAGERPDLAGHELLDGGDEAGLRRDLKEYAGLTDPLVLAHLDHRALGRQQRVLERADQRVGPGEVGPRVGWAAAELLLVQLDHRVRHRLQHVAGGGFLGSARWEPPSVSLWSEAASKAEEDGEPRSGSGPVSIAPPGAGIHPGRFGPRDSCMGPGRDG